MANFHPKSIIEPHVLVLQFDHATGKLLGAALTYDVVTPNGSRYTHQKNLDELSAKDQKTMQTLGDDAVKWTANYEEVSHVNH